MVKRTMPTIEEIHSAIGGTDGLSPSLQRALDPRHDFEPHYCDAREESRQSVSLW